MDRSKIRIPSHLALALSALLLVACDQSAAPMVSETHDYRPTLLHRGLVSDAFGAQHAGPVEGVLFDLAAAPNGNILIANAVAGITDLHGEVEMPLPGVTSYDPLGRGTGWATTGAGADPGANTGQALHRPAKDGNVFVADLFAYEAANDPEDVNDPGDKPADSNPYGVASLGGNAALVVDAGGNDLLRVDNEANIDLLAVFPNRLVSTANLQGIIGCPSPPPAVPPDLADLCGVPELPAEAVPTSVAVGPDDHYYVGELTGFPAPAGESSIWRVAPDATGEVCPNPACTLLFDGGFTSIIDLAFGPDGRLYVAELDEASWFAVEAAFFFGLPITPPGGSINACDLATGACEELASDIPILTAIEFDKRGVLYATRNALIPSLAEVFEVQLP